MDMQLGYLGNLGTEVELVATLTGQAVPITIAAVGRTYWLDQKPDGSRLIARDEIDASSAWTDCDYVTFYMTSKNGDAVTYDYDHRRYRDLGLAPTQNESNLSAQWDPEPVWYLRWRL